MSDISTTGFDYESLDADTRSKLEYFASSGKSLIRKNMIRFIADFGEVLSNARKVLANYGDGTFIRWATSEFDLSKSTIYNYVNAWDRCLSNIWTNPDNISVSALFLLSKGDTPSSVIQKAKRLTASKPSVTTADVQRLIDAAKPKPSPGPQKGPASTAKITAQAKEADAELESTEGPHDAGEFGTMPAGEDGRTDSDGTESEESPPGRGGSAGTDRVDSDEWRLARSKAKKTAEALMRALGDLNDVRKISFLNQSLDDCRAIINELDAMK